MRRILVLGAVGAILAAGVVTAQEPPPGMAVYYFGLLKKAPGAAAQSSEAAGQLQRAHIASMERRWKEGTLVGAGPLGNGGDIRGVLIIRAPSAQAARTIASDDPAVAAGQLSVEVHTWWGPAGIGDAYNREHAASPGAPPRMKTYQLAFLRRGPAWTPERTAATDDLQRRHLAHIKSMADEGALVAAGPFTDGGGLRGVFVFATDAERARALAARDPAVQAGRLALSFHPWFVAEGVLPEPGAEPRKP